MAKTCLDCSVFNPVQGMEGHPIFETEYDWQMHRFKSHGGPEPKKPELAKVKVKGQVSTVDASLRKAAEAAGPSGFVEAVDRRFLELESRVTALETQDTGLLDRVAALEKAPE